MIDRFPALQASLSPEGWVRAPDGTTEETVAAAERIAGWLARRDPPGPGRGGDVNLLVLAGSAVLQSVQLSAAAWHAGRVGCIVVTGGVGHSTAALRERAAQLRGRSAVVGGPSEAAVLGGLLRELGVPAAALVLEERSTNTGENAAFALATVRARRLAHRSVLLEQDPTMQRRTHATFELHWPAAARLASWAPFVPGIRSCSAGPPTWTWERFTGLLLGEVQRLRDDEHGYGPRGKGFCVAVEVPADVLASAGVLGRGLRPRGATAPAAGCTSP
ncbi:uncharacterized SAM-binding protein YcdF (DUF218 family) [Motilibacter peucedani]|uniref:Uncharacterized SAM-binding protein YcdF (DUF218 family) n=1 Tax=Motilibacter peucedani TaxID=598650 RepID=A0A420XQP9_9ACTN|nr:YdcF family protein [Motilibacter peucedani]RKS75589.1 uncharacterized SAM-binding protein YcdF (DUF218 family) [Motilibacter peucedani]